MSSILTNVSAMVALQNLRSINNSLAETQGQISTGKRIADSKDNSAIWAISKVMESDVSGFQTISDSLALGESTVAVARQAAETITDLLTDMKDLIASAQESNVDREKINTEVSALKDQIASVVSAAQFNGLNLVDGSSGDTTVLASLDRKDGIGVAASHITVEQQNLSTSGYVVNDVISAATGVAGDNASFAMTMASGAATETVSFNAAPGTAYAAGDRVILNIGTQAVSYTLTEADIAGTPENALATGLANAVNGLGIDGLTVSASGADLDIDNATGEDLNISGQFRNADSGALVELLDLDVSTTAGAEKALGTIEVMIQASIDSAAAFGSVESRISIQGDFVSGLIDSMTAGIGSLVDTDMEEASARLQALQVQQQLGVQALSIANQSPQSILSLFR